MQPMTAVLPFVGLSSLWEPHFVIHDDKKCVFLYRNPAWSSFKFKVFNELVQPQTLLDYADMQSSCSHFYLCQSRCILSTLSVLRRQVRVVRCMTLMQVLPDLPSFKWSTWPPKFTRSRRRKEWKILSNYYNGKCCRYISLS